MDEVTITTVKTLADLGGTVIVTAMLYLVWQRLNTVTDRLLDLLAQLQSDRDIREADKLIQERLEPQAKHNES